MKKKVKLDIKQSDATVSIRALSHDGRGIARVRQKTVFIRGALPNETVRFHLTQEKKHYAEGFATEIVDPHPTRVTPICPHFGLCGGCTLQHLSLDSQLELKERTLLEQLQHYGRVTPAHVLPALNGSTVGYRHKARLGVKFVIKKNKLLVGFREKSSRYLAELEQCAILHPCVGKRLTLLASFITKLSCFREIPQIEVAIGDDTAALVFRHLKDLSDQDKVSLIQFAREENFHLYLQPNPPQPVIKLWPLEGTELSYKLPDFNLEFFFHPLNFTQINLEMNKKMVRHTLSLLEPGPTDHILDLFCGIGNFSLPLAKSASHVTGVEGCPQMVVRAQRNAAHNEITNASFFTDNLENPQNQAWLNRSYEKALLDPPRAGAKEILSILKQLKIKRIAYVSCNPATFARDAGILVHEHGYHLHQVGIMNMFPHTSHIETIGIFDRT